MEFKYLNGQNRRTTSPPPRPLSNVAYTSRSPLRGYEFVPGDFFGNVSVPKVFSTVVPANAEEAFQRELEKEEIRREIIAGEMALTRRRELEEEVRREMVSERAFRIPMPRFEGISSNNNNVLGGSNHLPNSHFHVGNRRHSTQINKDRVILRARPNIGHCGGKRKVVKHTVEHDETLQKKVKQEWRCELCQITATSEKGLNAHIQGKKHKAKASIKTHKIGLDSRSEGQTLHPCLTPAHIGKLESKEEDQDVHKSKGLVGLDNQNEQLQVKKQGKQMHTNNKEEI